jgi:hypothetical protein
MVPSRLFRLPRRRLMSLDAVLPILIVVLCLFNFFLAEFHVVNPAQVSNLSQILKNAYHAVRYPKDWPPLEALVDGHNVTANVSWLLDFAVVGFPKCGTTSIMRHLQGHPSVHIGDDERCDLSFNRKAPLVRHLYNDFPPGRQFVRGIKCPVDLENNILALPNYRTYFPNTKFIVGMRHPVLWFESFYNFRVHNGYPMPPPNTLRGRCKAGMFNVCTRRSAYHLYLSNLGKTSMNETERTDYFNRKFLRMMNPVPMNASSVFLYEVTQLSDPDEGRARQFLIDLQHFLKLDTPLDPMIWFKPGMQHETEEEKQAAEAKKIDICDERFDVLREALMGNGRESRRWIQDMFLPADGVVVSSPDHFQQHVLAKWEIDPCVARRNRTSTTTSLP